MAEPPSTLPPGYPPPPAPGAMATGAPGYPLEPKVLHLAGLGRRFLAFLIDILLLAVVQFSIMIPFFPLLAVNEDSPIGMVPTTLGSIASFLYFWLFTGLNAGRTPGKLVLHLETVTEYGGPPTLGQAAVDALGKTYTFLLIDVLVGLFVGRPRRQRFSQKLAGLVVVRREPEVEQAAGNVRFVKT